VNFRRSADKAADDACGGEAGVAAKGQDILGRVRRGGDEEAAAGLRIEQDVPAPLGHIGLEAHRSSIARPVARRRAGSHRGPRQDLGGFEQCRGIGAYFRSQASAPAHLERVTEEAKAGDVGHRMDAGARRQRGPDVVELSGRGHEALVSAGRKAPLLEGGAEDADP